MAEYADTHCHLDHHEQMRPAEQIERARQHGVMILVTVGTDLASSTEAVQTAGRHDGVWATVGVHPNDAMEATPQVLGRIEQLAMQQRVVGVGETGLDYYRDWAPPDRQRAAYRRHIELAKATGKTLVVHCRDAWADTLAILEEEGPPARVVLHCFSGDASLAERCSAAGYFLSFAGNVTFKNAPVLRDAAAVTPLDQLLTETDSPFLTPHPHRGSPNEPANVAQVAACLADVKGLQLEEIAAATVANARQAFALPGGDVID
ncbi:MAG TPA: TatD family hydrolase [Nitriliruptorales bacterium]|nr:TatD family hydrolase [Nitriliruptorales bacterium]